MLSTILYSINVVLQRLASKIAPESVDPLYLTKRLHDDTELWRNCTRINCDLSALQALFLSTPGSGAATAETRIFHLAITSLTLTFDKHLQSRKYIHQQLMDLRHETRSTSITDERILRQRIYNHEIRANVFEETIENIENCLDFIAFRNDTLTFCKSLTDFFKYFFNKSKPVFHQLPEFIVSSICVIVDYYLTRTNERDEYFDFVPSFVIFVITNFQEFSNSQLTSKFVSLMERNISDKDLFTNVLLIERENSNKLIVSLVKYYILNERLNTSSTRNSINTILVQLKKNNLSLSTMNENEALSSRFIYLAQDYATTFLEYIARKLRNTVTEQGSDVLKISRILTLLDNQLYILFKLTEENYKLLTGPEDLLPRTVKVLHIWLEKLSHVNPTKIAFRVSLDQIKSTFLLTYALLIRSDVFLLETAKEERYLTERQQKKMLHAVEKTFPSDAQMHQQFANFLQKIIQERAVMQNLISEAPDEFVDNLMGSVMRNPVRLPSSGVVLDFVTVKRILLDKKEDPYTRQPLTIEQVEPQIELRNRIEAWIKARQN